MIRIHINTLFLIIISVLLAIIIVVLIRISIQIRNRNQQTQQNALFDFLKFQQTNNGNGSQPAVQSDFFKKSMGHAENVIKGIINADEYAKDDRQGSDIIRRFMYLNEEEKKALLTSINYYQSDPMIYSEAEKEFRKTSAQKNIPLWIVILDDAMNKNKKTSSTSFLKIA